MKTKSLHLIAAGLIASLSATIAQSKYSGIYQAGVSPGSEKILVAVTKGGHLLGLSSTSKGIKNALDPAKSTVNSEGKFKGVTGNGETSISGSISSDFKVTGTGKDSEGGTFRFSGERTLN